MEHGKAAAATILLLLSLAGCSDKPAKQPDNAQPTTASPATSPAEQTVETRVVDAAGDHLTMTMLPLLRNADGTLVVTIRTTLTRPAAAGRSSNISAHFAAATSGSADNIRLVDVERRQVYLPAPGTDGRRCSCTGRLRLAAGETGAIQAAFRGVPPEVTRLSVMLPYAGVFADVPVTAGEATSSKTTSGKTTSSENLAPPAEASHVAGLEGYTERLDLPLRSRITKDGVDLELGTDVLFDVDSATLTPAATKVIEAAAGSLRTAPPGPLTITGHTDSTADHQHNQRLSERRAAAVAAALAKRLPASEWPQTISGKGETQPAFPNDTADHRQLNRRVTITFKGGVGPSGGRQLPLPKTSGKQGTGQVEVDLPLRRGSIRFSARNAVRTGPFVQVDLSATNIGADDATILDYLGQGVFTVREELDPYAPYGAAGVRMLAGDTAAYNLDYRNEDDRHRCLCDRLLNKALPPGSTRTISLWFPAPADGITAIALDVPDRMRITGIPVS